MSQQSSYTLYTKGPIKNNLTNRNLPAGSLVKLLWSNPDNARVSVYHWDTHTVYITSVDNLYSL